MANDSKIILTPRVYPDDKIKIKKISDFNPFNQEIVLELGGEGYASFFSGRLNDENSKSIKRVLAPISLVSNSTITIQEHSSGELRVYDSQGNVTGVVNGIVREEIPFSIYDNESKTVSLFDPSSVYHYDIVGTTAGTYGLTITSIGKESNEKFDAINIPISNNTVYQYQVDWYNLSQGRKGVTVNIDSNGDGTFEQTILTGDNFQMIIKTFPLSKGWNLISIPLELENNSVDYLFNKTNITIYGYKNNSFFVPEEIDNKLGYWVKLNESYNITLIGTEVENATVDLSNGWNLLSCPYLEEKNISKLFDDAIVYMYNDSKWYSYDSNRTSNTLTKLKPGYGYWVKT